MMLRICGLFLLRRSLLLLEKPYTLPFKPTRSSQSMRCVKKDFLYNIFEFVVKFKEVVLGKQEEVGVLEGAGRELPLGIIFG